MDNHIVIIMIFVCFLMLGCSCKGMATEMFGNNEDKSCDKFHLTNCECHELSLAADCWDNKDDYDAPQKCLWDKSTNKCRNFECEIVNSRDLRADTIKQQCRADPRCKFDESTKKCVKNNS